MKFQQRFAGIFFTKIGKNRSNATVTKRGIELWEGCMRKSEAIIIGVCLLFGSTRKTCVTSF